MGKTFYPCFPLQSLWTCIKNENNYTFLRADGVLLNVSFYKVLQPTKHYD